MKTAFLALLTFVCLQSQQASAEHKWSSPAKIGAIILNGGSDAPNSGVTCFKIEVAVSAACPSGYIAVPNNNSQLIAALLSSKAIGQEVRVNYSDSEDSREHGHCPGLAFTPCVLNSVALQ